LLFLVTFSFVEFFFTLKVIARNDFGWFFSLVFAKFLWVRTRITAVPIRGSSLFLIGLLCLSHYVSFFSILTLSCHLDQNRRLFW
jgi:hypothetical protein